MNIHNVTDLVEDSIRLLDEWDEPGFGDDDFCADVRTLFDFQRQYSTSVTYFRVMNVLVRRGYFLEVPLEDHPDWEDHSDVLEDFEPDSISPVFERPAEEWDEQENPVVAYARDTDLYVRAGTELAERLVESGAVEKDEAELPEAAPLMKAVADTCEAAVAQKDEDTLLLWYTNLSFHFALHGDADTDAQLQELKADADLGRIRELVGRFDDLEMKLGHPECPAEAPPYPIRQKHPVLKWWYEG